MWLRVEHRTTFAYDAPISDAYTELRLRPTDDGGQRCSSFRLEIDPGGVAIRRYDDQFANDVRHFDILDSHDRLVVTASSEVYVPGGFADEPRELSLMERHDYLTPTTYAPELEHAFETTAPAAEPLERAVELMHTIHGSLLYDTEATEVSTTADEALALGRGVCQDFAHVLIAACRREGIPARYVSGYLFDPDAPTQQSASHAWVDVFAADRGWVSLDPTHDREQDDHYVRVAVGRDYADVPPTRGVYRGTARERLEVAVRVWAP